MKKLIIIIIFISFSLQNNSQDYKFITHELKPFTWKDERNGAMTGIVYERGISICQSIKNSTRRK